MVLSVLQDFPQLIAVFQQMQQSGDTAPTDAQWQELTDAVNARYAADLRWDALKAMHAANMKLAKGHPLRG